MSLLTHNDLPFFAHDSASAETTPLLTPSRVAAGKRIITVSLQLLAFTAVIAAVMAVKYAAFFLHFPHLH